MVSDGAGGGERGESGERGEGWGPLIVTGMGNGMLVEMPRGGKGDFIRGL